MASEMEFLGKCIDSSTQDWESGRSLKQFELALKKIPAFQKYQQYLKGENRMDFYGSLRCGLIHSGRPKIGITISSKNEMDHLAIHDSTKRLNLRCENFYGDFRLACEWVIKGEYTESDKINKPFLSVPAEKNS